ncbi:hypothetical protein WJX81_008100 [Elliptochloris bilobata]|uniref:DNA-(apurinic or apyrimidinic site) endonuclease n=1 Tax=Elliptochloris bilobata TaxID=381761 RepID=A0AAW1R306_9CHLO
MEKAGSAERRASVGSLDARWEFNAPRFYDFHAVDASPPVHRDGWFDTSQTAGLATPEAAKTAKPQLPGDGSAHAAAQALAPAEGAQVSSLRNTNWKEEPGQANRKAMDCAAPREEDTCPQDPGHAAQPGLPPRSPLASRQLPNLRLGPRTRKRASELAPVAEQAPAGKAQRAAQAECSGGKPLTQPAAPTLRTAKRRRTTAVEPADAAAAEEWRPLALQVAEFQASTPARFHVTPRGHYLGPPLPPPMPAGQLTEAKAPKLETDGRSRPEKVKSTAELEAEALAALPPFHARPINPAVLDGRAAAALPHAPPRAPTQPQSPRLATNLRAAAHPPAPQAKLEAPFVFKAKPAPTDAPRQTRASTRGKAATAVQPFQLSTEARGEARRKVSALQHAQAPERTQAFAAAPAPPTTRAPRAPPAPVECAMTVPAPFRLRSEARHKQALQQQQARAAAEAEVTRRAAAFKAALAPEHKPPLPLAASEKPLTRPQPPALALTKRAPERAAFNAQLQAKQEALEAEWKAEEERRAVQEAEEVKQQRRLMEFKARPMPDYSAPVRPLKRSAAQITLPESPAFHTRSRARRNFYVEVTLTPSHKLCFKPHPLFDGGEYDSLADLVRCLAGEGYGGGIRLLKATCKRFREHCMKHAVALPERGNFTLAYSTTIPRQAGLSGSSAIVCAALNCLLDFYGVAEQIPPLERPALVLSAEADLGITAGLQDRVIQVYGGVVYMDFQRSLMEERGHGRYEALDPALLPPLWLVHAADPSDSGRMHSDVRRRWDAGDPELVAAMAEVASMAEKGRAALQARDHAALAALMDRNFDLRRQMFGDAALGALNLRMVLAARALGAAAKFTGSGGAIVNSGRLRLVTWNINGLRSLLEYSNESLASLFKRLDADIVCFQETKLSTQDRKNMEKLAIAKGWESFFSLNDSQMVVAAELEAVDNQGRCVITDHGRLVLFNLYLPASTRPGQTDGAGDRFKHKLRMLQVLDHRMQTALDAGRAVLVVGDLNIAAHPLDHCHFARNAVMEAFLDERPDRAWLASIVGLGGRLTDLYRRDHPEEQACSVWSYQGEFRNRGVPRWSGCRVDYILAGGAFTLDPRQRPDCLPTAGSPEAPVAGSPDAGAAGAAPGVQRAASAAQSIDADASARGPDAIPCERMPLAQACTRCDIWTELAGSDHAPVVADFAVPSLVAPERRMQALLLSSRVRWSLSGQQTLSGWVTAHVAHKRKRHTEETPPRDSPE